MNADIPHSGSWFKEFWDALKSKTSIRPMIAVSILTGLAIFLPKGALIAIRMSSWVADLWPWIVVAFCLCTLMLLIHGIEAACAPVWRACQGARRVAKRIAILGDDEKDVLSRFCAANKTDHTVMFFEYDRGVGTLEKDGILIRLAQVGPQRFSYGLSNHLQRFINKNRSAMLSALGDRMPQH